MRLRQAIRWALAGLSIHVLVVIALLVRSEWNPQFFIHFGSEGSVIPLARQVFGDTLLVPHLDGHDGQAFWLLARDPLLVHGTDVVAPHLDRPAYRAQRIGYPLLAAPWHLAGETALVWGMLTTNLLVVLFGGVLASLLVAAVGAKPRASLAFALCPGVIVAVLFSLSDALALAMLLGTALALVRGRHGLAALCGVLGALAKESTLLGLVGFALLAPRIPVRARLLLLTVPTAVTGAWAVYARWRLGTSAAQVQEFAVPFLGYVDAWRRGWSPVGNWADAAVAFALIPLAALGFHRWRSRRTLLLAGSLPFLAIVPFLSAQVLDLALNSLRVVGPSVTLMVLDYYAGLQVRTSGSRTTPPLDATA